MLPNMDAILIVDLKSILMAVCESVPNVHDNVAESTKVLNHTSIMDGNTLKGGFQLFVFWHWSQLLTNTDLIDQRQIAN